MNHHDLAANAIQAPPDVTPMRAGLLDVHAAVDRMEKAFFILRDKLDPVVIDSTPRATSGDPMAMQADANISEFERILGDIRMRLDMQTDRVHELADRVRV